MAIKTYTEQLESVQAAIEAIESGAQEYEIQGRRLTRANLNNLYARESKLRALVNRENKTGGAGMIVKGVTPTR